MDTKLYDVGHIGPGMPLPRGTGKVLIASQQRVLELEDGDSFVLHVGRTAADNGVAVKGRSHSACDIAARLSSWAQVHRVRLTYRAIDEYSARIWRLGVI
jgi:hypothetical protein